MRQRARRGGERTGRERERGRKTKKEREEEGGREGRKRERGISRPLVQFPNVHNDGLDQGWARAVAQAGFQELSPHLPYGWQGLNNLSHPLMPPRVLISNKSGSRAEYWHPNLYLNSWDKYSPQSSRLLYPTP